MNFRKFMNKVDFRIEEAILVILVLLQFLDFFEVLPADVDFVKKIISWTVLGYLLYRASLTKIFFGHRDKKLDIAIILTCFVFIVNKFVWYAFAYKHLEGMTSLIKPFFNLMVLNASSINYYSFLIGGILIIILSIYISLHQRFNSPSVISIFGEEGYLADTVKHMIKRFLLVFLILNVFFIIFFNLMAEWLAIAIDAPIVFIGVLIYIFYIARHAKKFTLDSAIYKIASFAEDFYEEFIKHFKYKGTLLLGFGGMLILHLLTDMATYIFPYIFGRRDELYYLQLSTEHSTLATFLSVDLVGKGIIEAVSIVFVYIMNIIAIILLLALPAIMWYLIYNHKSIRISKKVVGIFALCLPSFILAPSFLLKRVNQDTITGVDITSISVLQSSFPAAFVMLFSIIFALIVFTLCYFRRIEKYIIIALITVSQAFFAVYLYYFFIDYSSIYLTEITRFVSQSGYFFIFYLGIFLAINVIFYIGGFIFFQYEIIKKLKHYIKF